MIGSDIGVTEWIVLRLDPNRNSLAVQKESGCSSGADASEGSNNGTCSNCEEAFLICWDRY